MAEASQIMFKFTEVAEALVKQQNIHEGYWGLVARFGIGAANINTAAGELTPAAIVPILELGLQKFEEVNSLTVDAAVVNPAPKPKKLKAKELMSGRR